VTLPQGRAMVLAITERGPTYVWKHVATVEKDGIDRSRDRTCRSEHLTPRQPRGFGTLLQVLGDRSTRGGLHSSLSHAAQEAPCGYGRAMLVVHGVLP
jgi:hypothetical protein